MVSVDYEQLMLTEQLLARQSAHAKAIGDYVGANCDISGHLGNGLLNVLAPMSTGVVYLGTQAAGVVATLTDAGGNSARASLDTYVAADKLAYERFAALMARLGNTTAPFADPRDAPPSLGAAQSNAGAGYGDGSSNIFGKAGEIGESAAELITGTLTSAQDRVGGWTGAGGGVVERSDPSSYLVTPDLNENFAQDLRWSAGIILGGLDWIAEFFLGFSVLEETVFKPFGGDWEHIKKSSVAWSHAGQACMELSSNLSGLPEQTESWEGDAADAFRAAMAALAGAVLGLSYAADYVSGLVGQVGLVSTLACSAIGAILGFIANNLLALAVEAALPVAGWAAMVVHAITIIPMVISGIRMIYQLIDAILDAIASFIEGKEKVVQSVLALEDIVEYSVKRVLA